MANGLLMSAGSDQRTCCCNFMPHMNVEQPLINYRMPEEQTGAGSLGFLLSRYVTFTFLLGEFRARRACVGSWRCGLFGRAGY